MLNRALELVRQNGWFDTAQPYEMSVNFTRGACIWLLLSRRGRPHTYVKLSETVSLATEAQRCAQASRWYPRLVPRFLGHAEAEGLQVLACEAVAYRELNSVQLQRDRYRSDMLRDLAGYFSAQPVTRLPQALLPVPNARLVDALRGYFVQTPVAELATRWLDLDIVASVGSRPDHPQHADLVINNLGRAADGSTVLVDWEDFGSCCLPGLDLFTLELSLAGGPEGLLAHRSQPGSGLSAFVTQACRGLQLPRAEFEALTPMHALAFRYLKRNYGPDVRERMDQLLRALDSLPAGGPARKGRLSAEL